MQTPSKLLFIVNAKARAGAALKAWREIADVSVVTVETNSLEAQIAAVANIESTTRLVAVGGDGSIHQLVNACPLHESFGLVPLGTGSDVTRSFRLPRCHKRALARIKQHQFERFDLMQCLLDAESRRGLNVLSTGFSAVVADRVNKVKRKNALSYLTAGIAALWHRKAWRVHVATAKLQFDGEILLVAIANGSTFGGGMRIAPVANPKDGKLNLVIVRDAWLPILLLHIPLLYLGWHTISPLVIVAESDKVEILSESELPIEIDGETYRSRTIDVSSLAAAVSL